MDKRPKGYEAAKTAIIKAFRPGAIQGAADTNYEYDINGNQCGEIDDSINLLESREDIESLRRWLEIRGIRTGFFLSDGDRFPRLP